MDPQSHSPAISGGNLNSLFLNLWSRIQANSSPFLTNPKWTLYVKSGPVPVQPAIKVVSQLLAAHTNSLLNSAEICCFTYTGKNVPKALICKYPKPKITLKYWSVHLLIPSVVLGWCEGVIWWTAYLCYVMGIPSKFPWTGLETNEEPIFFATLLPLAKLSKSLLPLGVAERGTWEGVTGPTPCGRQAGRTSMPWRGS